MEQALVVVLDDGVLAALDDEEASELVRSFSQNSCGLGFSQA